MDTFYKEKFSIGLYEKALPENLSWEEKLSMARDAGYSFMEISIDETDYRIERLKWNMEKKKKLRDCSEKVGIPLLTMCLSANRRFPIGSSFPSVKKKGIEIIFDAIIFASHLGIRIIQIAAYDVRSEEKSTIISREEFSKNLKKCSNFASSLGIMLAIENVESKFGNSLDKIMAHIEDINSPWLQIYPDIGNLTAMGQHVIKQLNKYASHIAAVHVKDTQPEIIRNIPFGEGNVDFISTFNLLSDKGFYGPILLEIWAHDKKNNFIIIKKSREWIIDKLKQSKYLKKSNCLLP